MADGDAEFHDGRVRLLAGDMRERLKDLPDASVDAVCCDPPYHLTSIVKRFGAPDAAAVADRTGLRPGATGAYARASRGFMGQQWDGGDVAFRAETWAEVWRVLKPGGHVVAFSGTRTYHRMACAIEDAGFEIRDLIAWLYGTGFPKSHDVSKAIDRAAGAERERVAVGAPVKRMIPGADQARDGWEKTNGREYQPGYETAATEAARAWEGWGTALKPALEPICFARKPLDEDSVASNVLALGTGAINIEACRVEGVGNKTFARTAGERSRNQYRTGTVVSGSGTESDLGRWPANVVHDGSDEVVNAFPQTTSGTFSGHRNQPKTGSVYGSFELRDERGHVGDSGSAARFFYSAKADGDDRLGSKHPTVKPVNLMRWLVRLVTPPRGVVLDPFAGTGTTGEAALIENFRAILIEREAAYCADIGERMRQVFAPRRARRAVVVDRKGLRETAGPLFDVEGHS